MTQLSDIERETARERQKLAESLDSLSSAVDPDNVRAYAASAVDRYGKDIGTQALDTAKSNPAAFALVGAGLALLVSGGGKRANPESNRPNSPPMPQDALYDFDQRVARADAQIQRDRRTQMEQQTDQTQPRAAWLREKLNDGLDALPDAARERVTKARLSAIAAQEKIDAQTRRMRNQSSTLFYNQPLAVGGIALGLGALVGALLPSTEREDEMMGAQRDRFMAQAQEALREELDKVRSAASDKIKGKGKASQSQAARST